MAKKEDEMKMWEDYNKENTPKNLNVLLNSFEPLIQKEVNVFKNAPVPTEAVKLHALTLAKKAFDTYNPSLSQLNTHVVNNLKKLNRYIYENQNLGKIPEHRILKITQFKSIKQQLQEKLNREPSTMELAGEMHMSPAEVSRLESELRQDLTIMNESGTEDSGGAFYLTPEVFTDKTLEAVHFVYYSQADPATKTLMENFFGLFGKPSVSLTIAAENAGMTYAKANKILKEVGQQISDTETNLK